MQQIREKLTANESFVVALDCFSVFAESKGILVVIAEDEVISIKLSLTNELDLPLKVGDIARMKGIKGELIFLR